MEFILLVHWRISSLQQLNIYHQSDKSRCYNQIDLDVPRIVARLSGLEKLEMDRYPGVVPPLDVMVRGKEVRFSMTRLWDPDSSHLANLILL